ncbi:uncharacterized protein LOC120149657 [Hibiscus syriacus]|uniref:uncharacterized protein LOC120149657 n=1 Tax=Hibiscus syriacus TaxID=106335 RepID=UPI0019247C09|nr:uncharacterized protein LOC120149657 [Hibiscus syriacus]
MASPAKTTSSSSSIPWRTNPIMRKSELCDPTRRSFSGNPFTKPAVITNPRAINPKTPASGPSDFPRRHSTGRGSVDSLSDLDKENSKDQNPKPTRLRSPAPSKGTKNFMTPTISAASKINASPRKKVLVERNEPTRSSVSFSDIKGLTIEDNKSTPEIALKQKKVSFSDVRSLIMEDSESTPEVGLSQKVSFVGVKSIIMEDNESTRQTGLKWNNVEMPRELQSNYHEYYKEPFKNNADAKSILMEDNESTQQTGFKQNNVEVPHGLQSNNYEYKESLKSNVDSLMKTLPEEKGSVKVIPSFEISSKVSVLAPLDADPLMHTYDPKTNYLSPRPQFLHYRPNHRIELYRERDCKQLEECFTTESSSDTDVSEETQSEGSLRESEDISSEETNPIAAAMVGKGFEDKRKCKPRFRTRSKFIALLLVLAFAYLSVLAANSNLEELSLLNFHVPPEVTGFAKAKFELFTGNLQHWSASFLSYVSNTVSSSREVGTFSLFEYANLSHVLESVRERDDGGELFDNKYYGKIEADEAVDEYEQLEDDEFLKNLELVSEEESDADEDEEQKNEDFKILELVSEEETVAVEQESGAEMIELDQLEVGSNMNLEDHPSITIPQATETMFPEEDSTFSSENSVDDSTINSPEDRFIEKNTMDYALLVLCLIAASALIYTKRGKPSLPNASVPVKQPVSTVLERRSSMNWQTEMDMASESCPSYMSSCYSKGLKEPNKYKSQERKTRKSYRRESLASSDSSTVLSSYGSFTTYDKIPSKHGEGDEVTPVRRSSRIRNQVTSP